VRHKQSSRPESRSSMMPACPNRDHRHGHARGGFSLIELLVVIAIVGLLVGLALPVLTRARQVATRAACASNLRQIGIAIEAYREGNGLQYPRARYMPDPFVSFFPGLPGLPEALATEMPTGSEVYHCPGDTGEVHALAGISYTYNAQLAGQDDPDQTWFGRRLEFTASEIPVAYDVDGGTFVLNDASTITVPFFHLRRNLLFADGHVGDFK